MDLLESTQYQSDFPERDYCMVVLFLNCGMRLSELVGMDLGDIDLEQRQISSLARVTRNGWSI